MRVCSCVGNGRHHNFRCAQHAPGKLHVVASERRAVDGGGGRSHLIKTNAATVKERVNTCCMHIYTERSQLRRKQSLVQIRALFTGHTRTHTYETSRQRNVNNNNVRSQMHKTTYTHVSTGTGTCTPRSNYCTQGVHTNTPHIHAAYVIGILRFNPYANKSAT